LIAHELAHGAFNLRHTFSTEENTFIAAQNTTENLMDYKGGTELWMHQWKKIQSPDRVWLSFLEGEEEGEWTTDGHYYLFTYVALLMGFDYQTATEFGKYSEGPDSNVKSEGIMEEQDTWLIGELQQRYHALTGGYHGIELAATSYALVTSILGDYGDGNGKYKNYLFHRFGDCFAHFANKNDSKGLTTTVMLKDYIDAIDKYINNTYMFCHNGEFILLADGKNHEINENFLPESKVIDLELVPTTLDKITITKNVIRVIVDALNSTDTRILTGRSYQAHIDDIIKYLPIAIQNDFNMYGDDVTDFNCFTGGHWYENLLLNNSPDIIVNRKNLFLFYVDKTIELLSIMYQKSYDTEHLNKIRHIIDWAVENKIERLDGIFAFEIMKFNLKVQYLDGQTVKIPEKYITYSNNYSVKGIIFNLTSSDFEGDARKINAYLDLYLADNGYLKEYEISRIYINGSHCWEYIFKRRK
jgi:hypothetical protein